MTKGLALSGGGSRGSFQIGALEYLYTVLNYRPDVIAATSVGSINGIALAQGRTPAEQLAQLNSLLEVWRSLASPGDFYTVRQWVLNLTRSTTLNFGEGLSIRIEDFITEFLFNNLINNASRSPSIADLGPLEEKIRRPQMFNEDRLAAGTPLRMVCVSLESGRTRYATGQGLFVEDDNVTPVASALVREPAIAGVHDAFTSEMASVRTFVEAIENEKQNGPHDSKWRNVARLELDLERALWRAEVAYDQLAAANASLPNPVQARIDPVIGALASSAMPGIFGPYRIGEEHYVDGGVRETVPIRAAVQMGATEVIAIVASTQNLPRAGYAGAQNFLSNILFSLT
jgi:NTE family protein